MSSWGQGGTRNWRRIRQQVLERDLYECQLRLDGCTFTATEVDHIHGVAAVGVNRGDDQDDAEFCRAVCRACHQRVTDKQRRHGQAQANALRAARLRPATPHPGD